jgi:hypothetical protein
MQLWMAAVAPARLPPPYQIPLVRPRRVFASSGPSLLPSLGHWYYATAKSRPSQQCSGSVGPSSKFAFSLWCKQQTLPLRSQPQSNLHRPGLSRPSLSLWVFAFGSSIGIYLLSRFSPLICGTSPFAEARQSPHPLPRRIKLSARTMGLDANAFFVFDQNWHSGIIFTPEPKLSGLLLPHLYYGRGHNWIIATRRQLLANPHGNVHACGTAPNHAQGLCLELLKL